MSQATIVQFKHLQTLKIFFAHAKVLLKTFKQTLICNFWEMVGNTGSSIVCHVIAAVLANVRELCLRRQV